MKKRAEILIVVLLIAFASAYAAFFLIKGSHILAYAVSFISASILFILLRVLLSGNGYGEQVTKIIIAASAAFAVAMTFAHPVGSDDYYRYIWDGKVMANGMNPYGYAPSDVALSALRTATLPSRINFPDMKTVYPPAGEIFFYLAYKIGGDSLVGLKTLLLISHLATIIGLLLIIGKLKTTWSNVFLFTLCPLPLYEILVDGHIDGFGTALLIFSIYFFMDGKKNASYFFLALSICVKPLALIVIPIFFLEERGFTQKVKTILIPVLVCIGIYLPFVFSGSPFQALTTFAENWTFNGIVFDILDGFIRDNQRTRLICGILFLIPYAAIVFSRKDLMTKIYLSIFTLFIFSPVVHPWYLMWLAVLIPIVPRWSGIFFVSLVSLTSITVVNYQLTGVWKEYIPALILEYIPVVGVFLYEWFKSERNVPLPL